MEWVSKKKEFFSSQKENLTQNIIVNLELDSEFLVQEEQREEGLLTLNNFVRREEGRGIGLGIILSKRVKGRKGNGLRIICPTRLQNNTLTFEPSYLCTDVVSKRIFLYSRARLFAKFLSRKFSAS